MQKLKIINLNKIALLPVLLSGLILSCNELLPPQPESLGYDYFPLTVGDFRVYQTQVINYNLDGSTDTLNYQLKEVVSDSSFANNEFTYQLDRFRRPNELEPWVIDSVWSARRNTYQAITIEHNIPIIKLSFPLAEDRRWDGNAMNALDFDEYRIQNLAMPFLVDNTEFVNSLEMVKEDLLDPRQIANDNYHIEVYSQGIGLIYKIDINKKYCNPGDCPQHGIIEQGIVFEQKLIEYGKDE